MKRFLAFLKKEIMEQFRSGKLLFLGILFLLFGILCNIAGLELGNLWAFSDLGNILIVFFICAALLYIVPNIMSKLVTAHRERTKYIPEKEWTGVGMEAAAAADAVAVQLGSATATDGSSAIMPGSEFTIPVELTANPGTAGLNLEVHYDTDVLTCTGKNHCLATALDIDCAIGVHNTHIARMQPTIIIQNSLCSLLVLIVTHHYVLAVNQNLTCDILGIL